MPLHDDTHELKSNTLGGHANRTWVDAGALRYCVDVLHITSFLDIGCGPGGMVELAQQWGLDVLGIDGDPSLNRKTLPIMLHDFYSGPPPLTRKYDLGWCVEVLEHIEERYLPNIMDAFAHCHYIIATASPVKGRNKHHVNVHPKEWWATTMQNNGFIMNEELTKAVHCASTMAIKPSMDCNFLQATGMCFVNNG